MKTHIPSTTNFNGKKLKDLRILGGKSLEELAVLVECDPSSISLWERGERRPNVKSLRRIAEFFKVPISTFFLCVFMTSLAYASDLKVGTAVGGVAKEYMIELPANQHARVAPHFTVKEFACHHCGTRKVSGALLYKLELLRIELGNKKVKVSSGYRCSVRNAQVGGAEKSQHMTGKAADIQVDGVSPSVVAKVAKRVGFSFVKVYPKHTHVDVR